MHYAELSTSVPYRQTLASSYDYSTSGDRCYCAAANCYGSTTQPT